MSIQLKLMIHKIIKKLKVRTERRSGFSQQEEWLDNNNEYAVMLDYEIRSKIV
ncbi:hypothetical protein [Bacillus sp. FJAT-45350]|uniref:hypothetical protein n=1 Tax=Bacillus sp. FJAT-45350 TaxID=2011014 RepID=UPI0015C9D7F6|nr:hypothetical protein [Bacillus sp. FJAT-45350]